MQWESDVHFRKKLTRTFVEHPLFNLETSVLLEETAGGGGGGSSRPSFPSAREKLNAIVDSADPTVGRGSKGIDEGLWVLVGAGGSLVRFG